jgi:hypothetical protein
MADMVAARLAGVLRQQQLQQVHQVLQPKQQQPLPQQLRSMPQQQQQQQQQSPGVEEDLRSSFGDFSCLQDLQNILDSC